MAWLELHQEIPGHPKTHLLMEDLRLRLREAVGLLAMHWLWALAYAKEGFIPETRLVAAVRGADWDGDPMVFANAMVAAGWWDAVEDGWHIHDWEHYAGRLIEKRKADAERKASGRSNGKPPEPPRGVRRTSSGHSLDGARTNMTNQHDQTRGTCAHARGVDAPPVVTPSGETLAGCDSSSEKITPISAAAAYSKFMGPPRGAGWRFDHPSLAVLVEAGEAVGVAADEVPAKIGRALAKRDDDAYDRWYAMDAATVALWARKACVESARRLGRNDGSVCNYAAKIIGDNLMAELDYLKPKAKAGPAEAPPPAPNPLASRPWWLLWTCVVGRPDPDQIEYLIERQRGHGWAVDAAAVRAAFQAGGVEAAMDVLWASQPEQKAI